MTTTAALKDNAIMARTLTAGKKAGCCPMCAEVRKVETVNDTTYIYCPRCGDRVEAR